MPRLTKKIPKLHRHAKGQAFVKLNDRRHWLGRYDDPASRERYDRLIAEWLANGRELPEPAHDPEPGATLTVSEVVLPYWRHVKRRYQPGKTSSIRQALRLVRRLYGREPVDSFGPKRLRVVRNRMIARGWSRGYINEQVRWIRSTFKWAASHELCDERIYRRLQTVEALRKGEADVPEGRNVKPVPREHVRRVRHRLTRPVRGLIELQRLTAARANELVRLRAVDLDTSHDVWVYRPDAHKTAHHGKDRNIYFGPRAQRILRLFMGPGRPVDRPLFCPREANAEGKRCGAEGRRRPNQLPTPTKSDRTINDHYTTASYRRAIHRACKAAGVPQWSPHQLRHTAATAIRAKHGAEAAQVILGHSNLKITEIYAERNEKTAQAIMRDVG
ncbi:MAG: site-specific integrase [Phycisphaeraceae bacterium]